MSDEQRATDIEILARIAAQLAGRDPDEHLSLTLAGVVVFDDVMWRYPDFLLRAQSAYNTLSSGTLELPS